MSRPRTPTIILEQRGAFRKNPQRLADRQNEAEYTAPLRAIPSHFSPDLIEIWHELLGAIPPGVATEADGFALEMACVLLRNFRLFSLGAFEMKAADMALLGNLLGRFGMTPSERSKVTAVKPKEDADPLSEFLT